MTKTHQSLSTKSKKGQLQHKKRSKGSFISDVNLDLTYLHFNKSLIVQKQLSDFFCHVN